MAPRLSSASRASGHQGLRWRRHDSRCGRSPFSRVALRRVERCICSVQARRMDLMPGWGLRPADARESLRRWRGFPGRSPFCPPSAARWPPPGAAASVRARPAAPSSTATGPATVKSGRSAGRNPAETNARPIAGRVLRCQRRLAVLDAPDPPNRGRAGVPPPVPILARAAR
jgi:hypothetical protein